MPGHWAVRLSDRSFPLTTHSFAYSALLALLARSTTHIYSLAHSPFRSLTCSLTHLLPRSWGKRFMSMNRIGRFHFQPTVQWEMKCLIRPRRETYLRTSRPQNPKYLKEIARLYTTCRITITQGKFTVSCFPRTSCMNTLLYGLFFSR